MKGFSGWIEVFRAGRHTDRNGVTRNWSKEDLDQIVSSFDPAFHEPPIVVGHPSTNAPSFGWVEALKREGDILFAKFKQVVPEFSEMVEKGLFKKRSISTYKDGRLKHVGFLGAQPPSVKGLKDIAFTEEDTDMVYEFADADFLKGTLQYRLRQIEALFSRLRENMIEKDGLEKTDRIMSSWDIRSIGDALPEPPEAITRSYSESPTQEVDMMDELQKLKQENEQLRSNISKAEADLKALKEAREKEFAEKLHAEESAFCDQLIKEEKMLPAEKDETVVALVSARTAGDVEFSEGRKASAYRLLRDSLSKRTKEIDMKKPVATKKDGEFSEKSGKPDLSPSAVTEAIREEMAAREVK